MGNSTVAKVLATTHEEKAWQSGAWLQSQCWEGRVWKSWICGLCSIAYLMSSRPVRDSASRKGEGHPRNVIQGSHIYEHTCARVHTYTKIKYGKCSVALVWTMVSWLETKATDY